MDMKLVSTVICDDVLANSAGRVTLYSIFRDLYADAYPAAADQAALSHVMARGEGNEETLPF